MNDQRPDPEALLRQAQAEQADSHRGRLKIFFGATAGVGKTYAMLEAAHERLRDGIDVVIGWIETHGRAETEMLVRGLERLPSRSVEYRGTPLQEFDIDAALARHPQLILMDELAHTNVAGSSHPKRWQDVQELLNAGITRIHHRQCSTPGKSERQGGADYRRQSPRDGSRFDPGAGR